GAEQNGRHRRREDGSHRPRIIHPGWGPVRRRGRIAPMGMEEARRRVFPGLLVALAAWSAPRGTEPDPFPAVMKLVGERAQLYEKAALGFSCEETVIQGKFSSGTGENKREDKSRYDYLYEGSPEAGYREVRTLPSKSGDPADTKEVDPDLDVPGAY